MLRDGGDCVKDMDAYQTLLGLALEQLPAEDLQREILVRTDIGGQTHAFTADCGDAGIGFSVDCELTTRSGLRSTGS